MGSGSLSLAGSHPRWAATLLARPGMAHTTVLGRNNKKNPPGAPKTPCLESHVATIHRARLGAGRFQNRELRPPPITIGHINQHTVYDPRRAFESPRGPSAVVLVSQTFQSPGKVSATDPAPPRSGSAHIVQVAAAVRTGSGGICAGGHGLTKHLTVRTAMQTALMPTEEKEERGNEKQQK